MANALHRDLVPGEEVVILKASMSPLFQEDPKWRVFVCNGGFGMKSYTAGSKIFGFYKADRESSYIHGEEIDVVATQLHQAGQVFD